MKIKTITAVGVFLGLLGVVLVAYLVLPIVVSTFLTMGGRGQIHCWVKVVNQEGKGVRGYKCRIIEEGGSWPFILRPSDATRMFETDQDGTFEYKSKGPVGRVLIGYAWRDHWHFNPEHLMEQNIFAVSSYEFQKAIRDNPSGYLGSQENPYLIHVFSVEPPQKLLYWKQRVKLKNPDNYACVDLLEGRIWESDKPEGDIAMKDNAITDENVKNYCLQSFIVGNNCSIYPLVDDWGVEAPDDGYKVELCRTKDWRELRKGFAGSGQIQVYYKLKQSDNGNIMFGRLTLGMTPRVNKADIENYTNLQGERNLFYKGYVRDYDPLPGPIQDYISPPVSLPLEKPAEAKPSEVK